MVLLARKLRYLLYITTFFSLLSLLLTIVSLATDSWYTRNAKNVKFEGHAVEIEYGLFSGVKVKRNEGGRRERKIKVVCEGSLCMYSCGLDGERRKQDIQNLLATNNQTDSTFCDQEESIYGISSKLYRQVLNENQERIEEGFFNIGYWISTIASLGIGIFWGVISAGLSFYNTQESPALSLLGIFGLYIWNALAAVFILIGMIIWGICFGSELRENGGVSDTISQVESYTGNGSLGYSYWILLLSLLFHLSNIGTLKFHGWKLAQSERTIKQVFDDKVQKGDNLLY